MIYQWVRMILVMMVTCFSSVLLIAGEKPKHSVHLFPAYTVDYHLSPSQVDSSGGFKLSTSVPLSENLTLHPSDVPKCVPVFAQPECPVGSIQSKGMVNIGMTYHY